MGPCWNGTLKRIVGSVWCAVLIGSVGVASGAGISAFPPPPNFSPILPVTPFNPGVVGALGQSPGSFAPQGPTSALPLAPLGTQVIPTILGVPPGSFSPAPPVLSAFGPNLGGTLLSAGGGVVSAPIQPFSMGPATLLNQFSQPPLVPFGQVGIPPASYNPSLGAQTGNPFSLTCNYYFFPNCGASGGQTQNFRYSTR